MWIESDRVIASTTSNHLIPAAGGGILHPAAAVCGIIKIIMSEWDHTLVNAWVPGLTTTEHSTAYYFGGRRKTRLTR